MLISTTSLPFIAALNNLKVVTITHNKVGLTWPAFFIPLTSVTPIHSIGLARRVQSAQTMRRLN